MNSLVSSTRRIRNLPQQGACVSSHSRKHSGTLKLVLLALNHLVPTHPATEGLKAVTLNNFTAYHFGKSSLNLTKITACSKNIYELGNPPVSTEGQFNIYIYFHTPSPPSCLHVSSAAMRPPLLPRKPIAAPKGSV